jgi:hypothetical protein
VVVPKPANPEQPSVSLPIAPLPMPQIIEQLY